jgi:hypothetical protein
MIYTMKPLIHVTTVKQTARAHVVQTSDVEVSYTLHREDLFSILKFSSIPKLTLLRAKRGLHVCRSCYVDIERIKKLDTDNLYLLVVRCE